MVFFVPTLSQLCHNQIELTSDARIILADGTSFKIHKTLLEKHSSFFKSLFTFHPDRKEHRMEMVSSDSMRQILDWMYCHKMALTDENIPDILKTAHYLDCPEVVQQCSDYLLQRLDPENVLGFWNYAVINQIKELEDKFMMFLTYHIPSVAKEEEFKELTAENLKNILKSNDLNMDEESVFHALMTWVEHDTDERVTHLVDLMKCLRLGTHTSADLYRAIFGHPLVQVDGTRDQVMQLLMNNSMPRASQDLVLVIGGSHNNTIESYDYRANRWTERDDLKDPCGPRWYMGAAVIGTKLFLVGGDNGQHEPLSIGCVIDLASGENHMIAPMKTARSQFCMETHGGKLFAVGGKNRQNGYWQAMATMEEYTPENNQWVALPSMRKWREGHTSAVHED